MKAVNSPRIYCASSYAKYSNKLLYTCLLPRLALYLAGQDSRPLRTAAQALSEIALTTGTGKLIHIVFHARGLMPQPTP
jgi:hypothetical protein